MYSRRRIWSFIIVAVLAASFPCGNLFAQQAAKIFVGEAINIHSEILGEDRTLYIYTPQGYSSTEDRYPVLYMLDGGEHFVHVSGIIHYLSGIGHIPQMIMVAIPNTRRTHDFTPTYNEEFPTSGGGEKFLNFLENEFIPYIDQTYRTQPYRILAGHSLTGTFTVYTLLTKPDLFGGYISISPSIGWDDGVMVKRAKSFFQKQARFNKFFYLTLGDEGEWKFSFFKDLTDTIRRTRPQDFNWKFVHMKDESHVSIPHKSVYDGLELLYKDWAVPDGVAAGGLESILNHYRQLTDKFGYTVSPSEIYLNILGYEFLNIRDLEEALSIFAYNIKLYPNSANVYDSYGEALERDSQLEKALENYQIAYNKGKENSDPNENIYRQNYERVKKYLEE
ncbi:MAG: alpha/beta hydrolase [Candidatus Zixiibacteriota bacterium]|nr:MAG: alpha/beta hydrolase [candidate division Zixibacteria bacterium]